MMYDVYCNIYVCVYTIVFAIVIVYDGANVACVAIWQVIKFRNNMCVCVRTHRKRCFFSLYLSCEANDIIAVFIVLSFIIVTREREERKNGSSQAKMEGKTN